MINEKKYAYISFGIYVALILLAKFAPVKIPDFYRPFNFWDLLFFMWFAFDMGLFAGKSIFSKLE